MYMHEYIFEFSCFALTHKHNNVRLTDAAAHRDIVTHVYHVMVYYTMPYHLAKLLECSVT